MKFLDEGDPRRLVWELCESPLEQLLCTGLFLYIGCRAVEGSYTIGRRRELAGLARDKPAAFLFAQHRIDRYRADFLLALIDPVKRISQHVVLECDGKHYHSTDEQIAYDAERDEAIRRAGVKLVLRLRGSHLHREYRNALEQVGTLMSDFGAPVGIPEELSDWAHFIHKWAGGLGETVKERAERRRQILAEEDFTRMRAEIVAHEGL